MKTPTKAPSYIFSFHKRDEGSEYHNRHRLSPLKEMKMDEAMNEYDRHLKTVDHILNE